MKINFIIKSVEIKEKRLSVILSINNLKEQIVKVFKGKVSPIDIKCNKQFTENRNFIYINNCDEQDVTIKYDIILGKILKHGHIGEYNENLITFSGDEVLIFPVEVLKVSDKYKSNLVEYINIKYDINGGFQYIVPFAKGNESICENPLWSDVFEIMKSSYTFGDFYVVENKCDGNNNCIFIEKSIKNIEKYKNYLGDISSLFSYYVNLFNCKNKNLKLVLLNSLKDGTYVFGGAGKNNICATFKFDEIRDWQLLSHRFFHSFMDGELILRDFHMPPNLWITEGLATYYENKALESLSEKLKATLKINFIKEIKKNFTRYLYMRIKDEKNFAIVPMMEGQLNSNAKMEFLHYTQAPLIISLVEDKLNKMQGTNDNFISYLMKTKKEGYFFSKDMFCALLGDEIEQFAIDFLFGSQILPLWYLKSLQDEHDVIEELSEYEYIIWTWFSHEDANYIKEDIIINKLNEILKIAEKECVHFSNVIMENNIRVFSEVLYKLLMEQALRCKICNLDYKDNNIRYKLLGDKENLMKWNTFIENVTETNI